MDDERRRASERYEVRHHLSESLRGDLLRLFQDEWWTRGRDAAAVERLLSGSGLLVAVVSRSSGCLAAFARVVTDWTFLAVIEDVIVAPEHRGRGLGRLVIETICEHPSLRDVTSIELVCQPGLVPFYQRWGFTDQLGGSTLMRRTTDRRLKGPGQAE